MPDYKQNIIDAAVEWQTYWSENPGDKQEIDARQGYLYDRVRRYKAAIERGEAQ